jgi:hypothetical protein
VDILANFERLDWDVGACSLETPGGTVRLEKGAVGLIPGGEPHAHRLLLGPGERALVLVFDEVDAAV